MTTTFPKEMNAAFHPDNEQTTQLCKTIQQISGVEIKRVHVVMAIHHYKQNDTAHQPDHMLAVLAEAAHIIQSFPDLEKWRTQIMLGCLFHDTHCHIDRDMHHLLGAEHAQEALLEYACGYGMSRADVYLISQAVLEHRASWKYPRINPVSNAVASADRGYPDLKKYIRRAVQYRYKRMAVINMNTIIDESIEHMVEKFGDGGYAWESYPTYAAVMHGDAIQQVKQQLRSKEGKAQLKEYAELHFDEWVE
ncbi:putative phosphohydrolase [Erwinia phage vB_EamM_Special G]|uniref:Putative phosphohydrolase n=1 Tax=Erwinia phage vB_EamM_Special G TaxID=1815989 RepID=A0A191ZBW8_9CAUD|nr:putative phosphohydrolase [Erwinia phage vB_EamM_Special G]ANJ64886.1 putative phosphohydrolase [Erwinia phage vB_EamM_Special G]